MLSDLLARQSSIRWICLFLLALLFGLLSFASVTHAATCYNAFGDTYTCGSDPGDGTISYNAFGDPYISGTDPGDGTVVTAADGSLLIDSNGNGVADEGDQPVPGDENQGAGAGILSTFTQNQMTEQTYGILISIGGWVTMVGGHALNIAVGDFVVRMGCLFVANGSGCSGTSLLGLNGQVGGVVNELWQVIRDLFNVLFIFGLIFLGLKTILQSDDTGTRKAIGRLLGAALLVNFSLYFAKLVLDIANFTAVQIYNAMSGGLNAAYDSGGYPVIADAFMQTLQITSWFAEDGGLNEIVFAIFAMIFLIYLGFIFLYGAFMIFARFIAMIVLLIFSPAMFLGWIWPNWEKYAGQWRTMFLSYAFFAPAYIFMLYVSLYVLIQLGGGLNGAKYSAIFEKDASTIEPGMLSIFVFYFVGIGLLYASTKVAQSMSHAGGNMVMKTGEKWARRMSLGAAAVGGGYLATSGTGLFGKGLTSASESMEAKSGKSSYLSRGLRLAGDKSTNVKVAGVNATKTYKSFADAKTAGDKRARGLRDDAGKKEKLATNLETLQTNNEGTDPAVRAVVALKPNAVVDMMKEKGGVDALVKHAAYLRPDQVKALEDDKELDKADVNKVLDARKSSLKDRYNPNTTTNPGAVGKPLKEAQATDLAVFDVAELEKAPLAVQLSDDQIKKLPEPKFIDADKEKLKEARKNALVSIAQGNDLTLPDGTVMSKATLLSAKTSDIAKYPAEALKAMADELPIPTLSKIVQDGTVSKTDQLAIRGTIQGFVNAAPLLQAAKDYDDWLQGPMGKQLGK